MQLPLFLAQASGFEMNLQELVLHSGPVAQFVLLCLFVMSIATWALIGAKWLIFSRVRRQGAQFLRGFREQGAPAKILARVRHLHGSPHLRMLTEGYEELQTLQSPGSMGMEAEAGPSSLNSSDLKFVSSTLERTITEEIGRLEAGLALLATTGSTAPFIGLFGTVWGVMRAFQGIGASNSTSIATVAPGISEALVATAAGLAAAIPAVMGFNHFVGRLKGIRSGLQSFSSELVDYFEKRYCRR